MNINLFLNFLIMTSCIYCLNWVILDNKTMIKKVGTNTPFIGLGVIIIRLFLYYPFAFPIILTVPFPLFLRTLEDILKVTIYNISMINIFTFAWWLISSVLLVIFIYRNLKLLKLKHLLIKQNIKDNNVEAIFEEIKDNLKIERFIFLAVSDNIQQSFTFGIIKPIVVIPKREYSKEELAFIIKHELFHVKYLDVLWKFSFNILKIIYWWLPTIHIISKQLDTYLEIRCDDNCLKHEKYDVKIKYLDCLLKEVRLNKSVSNSLVTSINTNKTILEKRFEVLLSDVPLKRRSKRYLKIIIIFIFMLSFALLFVPYTH
jgi:Antirepressor regulating drug resistance, predicted signal transduction N-terminal membrane component